MDIRSAQVFVALAETRHFGRAGERVHLSPSAVSRQLQRLEQAVGHRLFDRDRRHVALTPAGKQLLLVARRWVEDWAGLQRALDDDQALRGAVAVYASVTASYSVLAEVLPPVRRAHPGIEIRLGTGDQADGVARVDAGEADCAVVAQPEPLPAGLRFEPLARSPLRLVGPIDGGPLSARIDEWLALGEAPDWAEPPWVLAERGLARERLLDRFARDRVRPQVYAEVGGHEAVVSLVALGFGLAVVPRLVITHSPMTDRLRELPWLDDLDDFVIGLCAREAALEDPVLGAFWRAATTRGG